MDGDVHWLRGGSMVGGVDIRLRLPGVESGFGEHGFPRSTIYAFSFFVSARNKTTATKAIAKNTTKDTTAAMCPNKLNLSLYTFFI